MNTARQVGLGRQEEAEPQKETEKRKMQLIG